MSLECSVNQFRDMTSEGGVLVSSKFMGAMMSHSAALKNETGRGHAVLTLFTIFSVSRKSQLTF